MAQTPLIPSPEHASPEVYYRIINRLERVEMAAELVKNALRPQVPPSAEVRSYAAQVAAKQPVAPEQPTAVDAAMTDFERTARAATLASYESQDV